MWDPREFRAPVQNFYGHGNSINHVAFNPQGNLIASADADGVVNIYDIRSLQRWQQLNLWRGVAINQLTWDRSSTLLGVACGDGGANVVDVWQNKVVKELRRGPELKSHADAVNAIAFDAKNNAMVTAGSDRAWRVWSTPGSYA